MPEPPALPDPGRDEDPARGPGVPGGPGSGGPGPGGPRPGGTAAGWRRVPGRPEGPDVPPEVEAAWLEAEAEECDLEGWEDCPSPEDEEDLEDSRWSRQAVEDLAGEQAPELATPGEPAAAEAERRGPRQPGSVRSPHGEYTGKAAQFAAGMLFDVLPGGPELAVFADRAAGDDDCFDGVTDDQLAGLLCAWDRVEAHAAARKLAATAELIRRRPEAGCEPAGPARMPLACEEFTTEEVAQLLAISRREADGLLDLAHDLTVKLPGTMAALRAGTLTKAKASIIAWATQLLDPAEARAAENLVLARAGRLTPGGLRAAIARAVMDVDADKARARREAAARQARVQRWAEDSGNAALEGRELPPADVLAADQRVTWWARQLRAAGLDGDMDQLRALAYLDILLDRDSRPRPAATPDGDCGTARDGEGRDGEGRDVDATGSSGPEDRTPEDQYAGVSVGPGGVANGRAGTTGFAGRINLTVPLVTLLGLADRPGEIPGLGPIDPWLARDLATAAVKKPETTWCVTVTDQDGHAIGHGCARPAPADHHKKRAKPGRPGTPGGPDPPGEAGDLSAAGNRDGPGFAFTAVGQPGPPGGYGAWRLETTAARSLLVCLDPIAVDECDHRFEAEGHDPGVRLRHLAQVRHATCTAPACRRPAVACDFEHNVPYEAGGRTCMCNGAPKCRRDHRLKQHPRWKAEQVTPSTLRWTAPSGRRRTTEPTRYPI